MPVISDIVDEAVNYQDRAARTSSTQSTAVSPPVQRLQQTIRGLEEGIQRGNKFIKHVRYPKTLVKALKELEMLIGNDTIKGDVADNVNNIIMNKLLHEQDPRIALEKSMLNIALYGPPGVGKTTIGAKLAKIVYALGYLNDRSGGGDVEEERRKDDNFGMFNGLGEIENNVRWTSLLVVIFYVVIIVLSLVTMTRNVVSGMGWLGMLALFTVLAIIIGIIAYKLWPSEKPHAKTSNDSTARSAASDNGKKPDEQTANTATPTSTGETNNGNGIPTTAEGTDAPNNSYYVNDEPEIADSDLLTVVTRSDLVSRYVGNSDKDTLDVLRRNMGKVLFIDEAYQLYNGGNGVGEDKFGKEVLNVINQFLSEHPRDIVIIFAGYKEDMYKSIFKANPGLERRVMWHFDCQGYTGDELYRILELMCKQQGWTLRDPEGVRELVINYEDLFRNYGGDMEKVGMFARSAYNADMIDAEVKEKPEVGVLETRHVLAGIRKLQQNSGNTASAHHRSGGAKATPQLNPEQLNAMMNMLRADNGDIAEVA